MSSNFSIPRVAPKVKRKIPIGRRPGGGGRPVKILKSCSAVSSPVTTTTTTTTTAQQQSRTRSVPLNRPLFADSHSKSCTSPDDSQVKSQKQQLKILSKALADHTTRNDMNNDVSSTPSSKPRAIVPTPPSKLSLKSSENSISTPTKNLPLLPWDLDPKWNIPLPPDDTPNMRSFCTKYKPPKDAPPRRRRTSPPKQPAPPPTTAAETQEESNAETEGPQVQIVDGEIVLLESSLYLQGEQKTTEELDKELLPEIHEDNTILTATYNSFRKKPIPKKTKWNTELTKTFYLALRQCGTDFEMMAKFFGGKKTRVQLKKKYAKELRENERLIDLALNVNLPLDLQVFNVKDEDVPDVPSLPKVVTQEERSEEITEGDDADNNNPKSNDVPAETDDNDDKRWDVVFEDDEDDANNDNAKEKQEPETTKEQPTPQDDVLNEFNDDSLTTAASLSILPGANRTKKKKKFKAKLLGKKGPQNKKKVMSL